MDLAILIEFISSLIYRLYKALQKTNINKYDFYEKHVSCYLVESGHNCFSHISDNVHIHAVHHINIYGLENTI